MFSAVFAVFDGLFDRLLVMQSVDGDAGVDV
jgi:hypothetical protein